ncbi:MAG: DASS family sodium-coupled anion symporter [Candidatus Aenigmarchaeota archaeon]|nr:DASS family sodium-coupled anion symporter [Candidatus Aenigmarchaeota archaeon]
MKNVRAKFITLSFVAAFLVYVLPFGLPGNQQVMLAVMALAVCLWITEAIPLHVTALFVAFLLTTVADIDSKEVFSQYFDPVIVLLLGGFVIAMAMRKYGLDEYIAYKIIKTAGRSTKNVVFALLFTTAFISMWISNSAAAAIIMPIALVILAKNRMKAGKSNFGKASVLAVAYGATIGGLGTIVGSTPNVIAAKFLQDSGTSFGFFEWFYRGFPFMLILLVFCWAILVLLYKPEKRNISTLEKAPQINRNQKKVLVIFLLTIILWLSEPLHGISSSVVAIVPIILFYFAGLLEAEDFTRIDWPTLLLVGGGLALGFGIHQSALDSSFASILSNVVSGQSILALLLFLGFFGILMTVVVSNTTAAAVYLPIIVALASTLGADTTNIVVVAAMGVSLDFMFPFGTPPTAIAYGTKFVNMKDIAKAGIVIAFIGLLLLAFIGLLW